MRFWHSLYEIFRFPIQVLIIAMTMLGVGNLFTNEAFTTLFTLNNDFIVLLANILQRIGTFILFYIPLLLLLRLVAKKTVTATTTVSAFVSYVLFQIVTMYFAKETMPTSAYSSILGLSMSTSNPLTMTTTVHYPIQTGILATAVCGAITLWCFARSRHRTEYSVFSFIDREVWCVLNTAFWTMVVGIPIARLWPYVIDLSDHAIRTITNDTLNPVNLAIYGVLDRVYYILGQSTLIRTPFWYSVNGGSWVSIAGENITGDVSIWTAQALARSISGMSGRFITPYYVLNIFAIPGMILAGANLQTDRLEKRRMRGFYLFMIVLSFLSGSLVPIELAMLFLCPLLLCGHLMLTGVLFGILHTMKVYIGFQNSASLLVTASPGTLPELLVYVQNPNLFPSVVKLCIVGLVYLILYYIMTRVYFKHFALDFFRTGMGQETIDAIIKAVGGVENIKLTHASMYRLTLALYNPTKMNVDALRKAGGMRVSETRAGYAISFGASSIMIRMGIQKRMRESIRNVQSTVTNSTQS